MKQRQRTSISLEAIRFQTDKKAYKELVGYFGMMRNSAGDPVDAFYDVVVKQLVKAINHHYNINLNVRLVKDKANEYTLAVVPPMFTEKHPLVTKVGANMSSGKANAGVVKELIGSPDKFLGFGVDYETGKVTGLAANLEVPFYIGESLLRDGNVTAEWLATQVIHEVGHVVTYFLSLRYATSTSWAIRYAVEALEDNGGDEAFLVSMEKFGGIVSAQDVERTRGLDAKAKQERVTLIILDRAREATKSQLGTSFADRSSAEALADQFVVRHADPVAYAQCIEYFATQNRPVINWVPSVGGLMLGWILLGPLMTAGIMAAVAATTMWAVASAKGDGGHYDKPCERVIRLRNDLVSELKASDLPEQRNALLAEIKALDGIIPTLKQHEGMLDKLLPLFSSNLRNLRREQSLVQTAEALFNNPLYVRQAQLAQISEL